ncbi:MAG: selenide, water dikinase SelD, partial [Anaerobacillus sp.]
VYAMGGVPKTVLNIVGFPIKKLSPDILTEILKGAADKVEESGAVIAGGHSIDDQEPKFGLSVTGLVHPDEIYMNVGAKPGDAVVLTKPIGVGIQTTAIKPDKLTEEQLSLVSETMAELNKTAAEELKDLTPHAVTDVTGFGLLGHAYEMATGSNVSIHIAYNDVPVLPGTNELAEQGYIPGGSKANHRWIAESVRYDNLNEIEQYILCDAVTSGGLLISMPADQADIYTKRMHEKGKSASIIGHVTEKASSAIFASK